MEKPNLEKTTLTEEEIRLDEETRRNFNIVSLVGLAGGAIAVYSGLVSESEALKQTLTGFGSGIFIMGGALNFVYRK